MYMGAISGVVSTFPDASLPLPMGLTTAGSALGQLIGGPVLQYCVDRAGWAKMYR